MTPNGNKNAEKHGAESGIKRLSDGKPFTGLAALKQHEVETELANDGLSVVIERRAVKYQALADIFSSLVEAALEAGDEAKLMGYSQRYHWLQDSSFRAWDRVKANRKASGVELDAVLKDYDDNTGE